MARVMPEQTIWFPGVYVERSDAGYGKKIADVSLVELTELVQRRAHEDGQWLIDNGLVGEHAGNMHKMIAFVARERNIQQCVGHILKEKKTEERTADWVCRELAKASKYVYGSSD